MRDRNIQVLWADLIIEELLRLGVSFFGYAPGSRNSLFAAALSTRSSIETTVHFDERALAFMALGAAKTAQKPSVLIATSGTAGVNFLPAIVEAYESGIPLFVITGDRPYELLEVGEGQTIDQVKMYQNFSRGFFDLPVPSEEMGPEFVLSTVDALHNKAVRMRGPVHLNAHFREPLLSLKTLHAGYLDRIKSWDKGSTPYAVWSKCQLDTQTQGVNSNVFASDLEKARSGFIIVGRLDTEEEKKAALSLIEKCQWPAFVDVTSGLFFEDSIYIINHYDWILTGVDLEDPSASIPSYLNFDTALHLGHEFISKRLRLFLKKQKPKLIYVAPGSGRYDPGHVVRGRLESSIEDFCASTFQVRPSSKLLELQERNKRIDALIEAESFPIQPLAKHVPENHLIFLASSLSIRDFAWFVKRGSTKRGSSVILANRGASGIDGTIASAIGAGIGLNKPVTLFIGDLAFLHDLTSLSLIKEAKHPIIIIAFNNQGGGIFHLLPVAKFEKIMPFVEAKHPWPLEPFIKGFGLRYTKLDMLNGNEQIKLNESLEKAYLSALETKESVVLEILIDAKKHAEKLRAFTDKVKLAEAGSILVH